MKGREDVPGLIDVNVAELQVMVDKLATEMAEFEPNELCGRDIQREIGLIQINAAFRAHRGIKIPVITLSAMDTFASDNHNLILESHTPLIIIEFKKSMTGISSLPDVQLGAHFITLIKSNAARDLLLRWRVPCLGITIVGELQSSKAFFKADYFHNGYV